VWFQVYFNIVVDNGGLWSQKGWEPLLYSVFSDEDMQSLASLMSLKQSDIGNLEDFNDSDEEEDKRLSAAVKMATAVIGINSYVHILMQLYLETGISCSKNVICKFICSVSFFRWIGWLEVR